MRILRRSLSLPIVGALVVGFSLLITPSQSSAAEEEFSSIARGGKLYDKWYKTTGADKPSSTHKAWPASNTKKKGATTWRCKSCHGWDFLGKDGAYASGSYLTGIKGIRGSAGADPKKIIAILTDKTHGFNDDMLDEDDMNDLAMFVSKGTFDLDKVAL